MLTYILFFSAIVAGLICKKSKWISAYMLSIMFVLSVYKYNCSDLINYQNEYNNVLSGFLLESKYIGHYFIIVACTKLGLSFTQYLQVYYFIIFAFLYFGLKRLTKNVNLVMSFYMIYSFGVDVIQMKNMLADAIVLFALSFLFEAKLNSNNGKKDARKICLFCFFSIAASTIHFISILFLIVGMIYYYVDDKRYKEYVFAFTSIVFVFSYVNILPVLIDFIGRYIPIFNTKYVSGWLEHKVQFGWILLLPPIVLVFLLALRLKNLLIESKDGQRYDISFEIANYCYSVATVLPLLLYTTIFVRYLRVFLILLGIVLSRLKLNKTGTRISINIKQIELLVGFIIILVYLYLYDLKPVFDTTLGALLNYNSLLN